MPTSLKTHHFKIERSDYAEFHELMEWWAVLEPTPNLRLEGIDFGYNGPTTPIGIEISSDDVLVQVSIGDTIYYWNGQIRVHSAR